MKDYLKNLFATRRVAFYLNLAGLTLAFVIFYVLMAEVKWVHGFDKFHDGAERICRMDNNGIWRQNHNGPTGEWLINNSADAFEAAVYFRWGNKGASFYDIGDSDSTAEFKSISVPILDVTKGLPKVFTFDMVEGNTEDFETPGADFFPLSICQRLFGMEGPYVGRTFSFWRKGGYTRRVSGVYRDFPTNSILSNCIYHSMNEEEYDRFMHREASEWASHVYAKVHEGMTPETAASMITDKMRELSQDSTIQYGLPTLHELYFMSEDAGGEQGSRYMTMLYFLIAWLVMAIAAVNYMNFEISLIPYHIKEINVRRVFGSRAWPLRWKQLGRAFFTIVLALCLSLVVLNIIDKQGWLLEYMHADMAFSQNLLILGVMGALTLVILLVSGVYPAWYSTSRKPALVINGNFALSEAGRALRRTLVGMQFTVSMIVITFTLLMTSQTHFLYNTHVGYARDSILYMNVDMLLREQHYAPIMEALNANPDVKEASWSRYRLGESDYTMGWGRQYKGEQISFKSHPVQHNFLSTMGVKLTEGRGFRPEDSSVGNYGKIIFNETARKAFNLELNDHIGSETGTAEIIGFIEDIKSGTLHKTVPPTAYYVQGTTNWGIGQYLNCAIRLTSPDKAAKVSRMLADLNQELTGGQATMKFYTSDDIADIAYAVENKQFSMVLTGAIISLVISLMGVFGLVLFETQSKRKEIGVRKVFGATTRGILWMFNAQYLRILVTCFVIAAPVAHYLYMVWVESFAYRTPLHWWLFGVAFLIVAAIVCLTVTVQSWRAAKERPVETIMK